jgi:pimeloyl-ACP methyl ester carboxylesterase
VVGWLSCDSIELGPDPRGVERLVQDVVRKSSALVFRMDKPGVGDSEGDCARTDFDTELDAYRRAFEAFRRHPRVDPARIALFGISNGGGFAPLVAGDTKVAAYLSIDGWSKTWFEHMIDLERRRLVLSGTEPAKVTAQLKPLMELHAAYLFDRLTPAQVLERRPQLKGVWYDEPDSQYGRPASFYHQLQDLELAAAWGKVRSPTLVVWGDYDWIMDRADQEQIVRLVGPSARLLVVPRADHGLTQHPDEKTAFEKVGRGEYPTAAAEQIVAFIQGRR